MRKPEELRECLTRQLGRRLGHSDDLPGLMTALGCLDKSSQDELLEAFAHSLWLPRDGDAAAAFLAREMPDALRKQFLTEVTSLSGFGITRTWADGAGSALLVSTLGQAEATRIKEAAEQRSANFRPEHFDEDDGEIQPLPADLPADESQQAVAERLTLAMAGTRDYHECFARGLLGADEILAEVGRQIPGSEAYPEELARAFYMEIAPHDPAGARRWASGKIPESELGQFTVHLLEGSDDPRAKRLAEVLHELPLPQAADAADTAPILLDRFKAWSALDPAAAREAAGLIPASHPYRQYAEGHPPKEEEEP